MKNSIFFLVSFMMMLSACSNADFKGGMTTNAEATSDELAFYDQDSGGDYEEGQKSSTGNNNEQIPGQPSSETKTPTKIIKKGEMGIMVKDYVEARKGLDELMGKYEAYIADEDESKSRSQIRSNVIIRIPSKHFDAFMNEVGGFASKVNYKRINAEDVTRQYVDIQSRLKLKKEVRDKYESFLKNAKNVEEMLAIEREVRMLTEEIEAKEAELRYLSDKVNLSTITLSITQKLKYQYDDPDYAEPSFFQRVGKGFTSGWEGVLSFFVGLTYLWPLLLFGIILFLAVRKPTKRFLKRLFGTK